VQVMKINFSNQFGRTKNEQRYKTNLHSNKVYKATSINHTYVETLCPQSTKLLVFLRTESNCKEGQTFS
jgi:hypothetical protein